MKGRDYNTYIVNRLDRIHRIVWLLAVWATIATLAAIYFCYIGGCDATPRLRFSCIFTPRYQVAQAAVMEDPAAPPPHDPVLQRKITDCADYVGTVNYRLQDGRAYEVARILVTASKEAGNEWGWELPAAIARHETRDKFNITSHNTKTQCYGLLQVRYKTSVHGATMDALGLKRTDPYDSVLYGCMMLAQSHREGKSLSQALVPWGAGIKGRIPSIIKEYENLKELYRR